LKLDGSRLLAGASPALVHPVIFLPVGAPTKPSLFRRIRIAILVLAGLLLVVLFEPHLFRFVVKHGVLFSAGRHGVRLEIGGMEGSLFEPLLFQRVRVETSRAGVVTKVNADSADVRFSWRALVVKKGHGFFDSLTLDRVNAEVTFQPDARQAGPSPTPAQQELQFRPWLPAPAQAEVLQGNFAFHLGDRAITFSDVRFTLSSFQPGMIAIGKLTAERGRFRRRFDRLRGTTAIQGTEWRVADLTLSEGVVLKSLSTDLDDLARGQLQVDFDFAAFGGSLRGELLNTALGRSPAYEITGNFANLSVEALGRFLEVQEKTGGNIKEGIFSFRGSPHALENATVSTRFEATDFLWGARRWNSLVLGATIVDRRVQIPKLELHQAHNTLHLKGDLVLPVDDSPWWLSNFSFDIAARIDNLTELSALFGPEFADASGKMTLDGSIRGDKKSYSGQLLVAGSKLAWRGVPFDLLNAGIKLDGNELQILNLEATHGSDFVRGKGMITILGERRYSGELNASIEELAVYGPLLQKPIVPAPPVGGLVVNWAGDGTAAVHSGAFTARFRKLHTPGNAEIPPTLPIDADVEGTYAPGGLSLTKFVLANAETRVEGRLAADEKTLTLEGLKLTQKKALWLEGNATLPFNLFQWWVQPGPAAFAPDAPFKAQLNANGVQLEEVAHLTGRPIPIRGLLSGTLKTESTLRTLRMTGIVKLTKGQLPASEWIPALEQLEADAEIDGNVLRISKLAARHALGDFSATGSLDFSKFDLPAFDLLIHGEQVRFQAGPGWAGAANLDWTVTGTREAASVTGSGEITRLDATPYPDFGALITTGNPETIRVPPPTFVLKPPFDRWSYRVDVATAEPLKIKGGTASAELRFRGSGTPLTATGSVTFTGLPTVLSYAIGKLESGTWFLGGEPTVVARLSGKLINDDAILNYTGYYLGPLYQLNAAFSADRPEDDALIRLAFTPGAHPLPPEIGTIPIDLGPLVYNPKLAEEIAAKQAAQSAPSPTPAPSPSTLAPP